MKKVKSANKSKSLKAEKVGPKKEKLFGQETEIPVSRPKKEFNKVKFERARKSHFKMK